MTAGVLKGSKARFQLFGDTMNTASRMESTGLPGRIQVSSDTADLLKASGKDSWLIQREDLVDIKGKGKQATYFLNVSKRGEDGYSSTHDTTSDHSDFSGALWKMKLLLIPTQFLV